MGYFSRAQVAPCAGLVLNGNYLPQFLRQPQADKSGHGVYQVTRREGHDQPDGLGGGALPLAKLGTSDKDELALRSLKG